MTVQDNSFYQAMGKRIAQFRKAQSMTQTQLADALGIAQQTMAHYEGGRLRMPVALLPKMATLLAVSIEEIVGEPARAAKGKRGPTPRLQRQVVISQAKVVQKSTSQPDTHRNQPVTLRQ